MSSMNNLSPPSLVAGWYQNCTISTKALALSFSILCQDPALFCCDSSIAAWWYLESEIQILEWFACRACHSTHSSKHWQNSLKTAVKAFFPVFSWFVLFVLFPHFFYVYLLSFLQKRFQVTGWPCSSTTVWAGQRTWRCAVQSKEDMGTHALHAQCICKVCKEKIRTWKDASSEVSIWCHFKATCGDL